MFDRTRLDELNLLTTVGPVLQRPGTIDSAWISIANLEAYLAVVSVGAFGPGATVDAVVRQARDDFGADVKIIHGRAITQLVAADGDSRQAMVRFRVEHLDAGFEWLSLQIAVGGAATAVCGQVFGAGKRYADLQAVNLNAASVVEVV